LRRPLAFGVRSWNDPVSLGAISDTPLAVTFGRCLSAVRQRYRSSNGRCQPRSDTGDGLLWRFPVRRHALAPVKAAILLGRPVALIAPGLEIRLGASGQKDSPRGLKCLPRLLKRGGVAVPDFAGFTVRIEAAAPMPGTADVRQHLDLLNLLHFDVGIVDQPGLAGRGRDHGDG
jgi:hypothetical protein